MATAPICKSLFLILWRKFMLIYLTIGLAILLVLESICIFFILVIIKEYKEIKIEAEENVSALEKELTETKKQMEQIKKAKFKATSR